MTQIIVSLLLNIVFCTIVYLVLKRKFEREMNPDAVLRQIRGEVNELIVELNQTTERNVSLIEERIAELNRCVEESDKRLSLLKRESERNERSQEVYSHLNPRIVAKPDSQAKKELTKREQVIDLYNKGMDPKLIASRLDITLGEIELIISLGNGKV
jgi:DNA-binding NarL/FixJ family response regulator